MAPLPPPRKRFYFCKKIQLGCAGLAWPSLFGNYKYISLWKKLDADPADLKICRNLAGTQPLLWLVCPDEIPLLKVQVNKSRTGHSSFEVWPGTAESD